jgi:protein-S-isoprenylcysteine O-methyltransferase Ste14
MNKVSASLLKSVLHNFGVVFVSFAIALLGTVVDRLLGVPAFSSRLAKGTGLGLVAVGFLVRVWATFQFYEHRMRVISLKPQSTLITDGPFRFSRNPLYLGGNVFMFFGAALLVGSPTALVATAIHMPLMDRFIRREEAQLHQAFGEEWQSYKKRVRRWL